MVVSMRAREDFLLHVNELLDTLKTLVQQKNSKNINAALVTKAAILMKRVEESAVDVGRPLLDKGLVREYQLKMYPLANDLVAVLNRQFWESFSAISRTYHILEY